MDTYGTIDELNSIVGVVRSFLGTKHASIRRELIQIQHDLFELGAYLANPTAKPVTRLVARTRAFEARIDAQTATMPMLRNFILPGGGKAGATLHHARTVCRRAERRLVALMQDEEIDEYVVQYINRLSDLLFSTARYINYKEKKKETIWTKQG